MDHLFTLRNSQCGGYFKRSSYLLCFSLLFGFLIYSIRPVFAASPIVSLTAPAANIILPSGAPIMLNTAANDADNNLTRVEFYDGLTKLGEDTTAPYTYTWSGASLGDHAVTAKAIDATSNTTTSSAVVVTVGASSLPANWTATDVGSVGIAGNTGYKNNTFTLSGSGADVYGTTDQFRFVYQTLAADGEIIARVTGLSLGDQFTKAGIMMRENTAAGSRMAQVSVLSGFTNNSGTQFVTRVTTNGSAEPAVVANSAQPEWLKLIRTGTMITAYTSMDGTTWVAVGSPVDIGVSGSIQLGLFVCSRDNTALSTATFDNVSVTTPTVPTTSNPELARTADSFVDSIGVNVHLYYDDTAYGNSAFVRNELIALGVRHVRDSAVYNPLDSVFDNNYYSEHRLLAQNGITSTLIVDPRSSNLSSLNGTKIAYIKAQMGAALEAFEGPNEYDISGNANWITELRAYQQSLYTLVKAGPTTAAVPVLAPSLVNTNSPDLLGDLGQYADYSNKHSYPGGTYPSFNINNEILLAKKVGSQKPVIETETGYHNAISTTNGHLPASEVAAGKYIPRLFFEYFNRGIARSYIYELLDEQAPNNIDIQNQFGLIRFNRTEKPSYLSLKNTISLLSDPGAAFTPGSLDYTLGGDTTNVDHTLLEKRNGRFYLALWQEVPSYDPTGRADISVTAKAVTITINTRLQGVQTYQPSLSVTPTTLAAGSGQTILSVLVQDHPLIIELIPLDVTTPFPSPSVPSSGGAGRRDSSPPTTSPSPLQILPTVSQSSLSLRTDYQAGDIAEDIYLLQKWLNANGFILVESGLGSPGNETNKFGAFTFKALMKYQQSKGLPITGYLGPLTRAALNSSSGSSVAPTTLTIPTTNVASPSGKVIIQTDHGAGDIDPDIYVLQKWLNANGYIIVETGLGSPGNETNKFGAFTFKALMKYQQNRGLPVTGYLGPLTRAALQGN